MLEPAISIWYASNFVWLWLAPICLALWGIAGTTRRWQYRPWLVLLFGIDVIPLGIVSAILVLMQGFVVGSFCTLCLVTAAISLLLILFAYDEVWASLMYLRRVWKTYHDKKLLWNTFWGFADRGLVREVWICGFAAKHHVDAEGLCG